jgi:hypothetical protein
MTQIILWIFIPFSENIFKIFSLILKIILLILIFLFNFKKIINYFM